MDHEWCRKVEIRLQELETHHAVDEVHRMNVEKRLASIEDSLKWLVRLIFGALVLAALAYAMRGGLALV